MRIYTRTGDDGTTGLGTGERVDKDSLRLEAYGTVDELNSTIGVAIATGLCAPLGETLSEIQKELFVLGADLCIPDSDKTATSMRLDEGRIEPLEILMDELSRDLASLRNFILPGGSVGAAHLHVARTVCRRAERLTVSLSRSEEIDVRCIRYLNRLSDALFVMARFENHARGLVDVLWKS